LQPSGGGLVKGTPHGAVAGLGDLQVAPLWLQMRIVPQTGGFGPAMPLSLAGPVNGPVALGTTPGARTMRFRVDYRIQDLDLTDDIHPAGLGATHLDIIGAGAGNTSDTTVSRATLSSYEANSGASPAPGPTNSGFTGNTDDDDSAANANGRAGLVGPFRGGMVNQDDNNLPTNGSINGLSINTIVPLRLSQIDLPVTSNEWYPLYVFMISAGDNSAGSVTFTTSINTDPTTRTAFSYFNDGDPRPRTSRVAFGSSITVNIPAV
jgi:hypothetical protein